MPLNRVKVQTLPAAALLACLVGVALPSPVAAQTVSGRVVLKEKPGETPSDLANAVVYLVPKSGAARTNEKKTEMAMDGRQFSPRVIVVTPGSSVQYPNKDPFSHNIFSTAAGAAFDLGVYGSGPGKATQFRKAGAYPVYCNIHAKMTAYVVVVNTPWHVQPTADGRWSLAGVPAGKYELHIWHERGGALARDVEVTAAGLTGADGTLDASGYKLADHKDKNGKDYTAVGVRY